MTSRALWLAAGALVAMIAFGVAAARLTRPTPKPDVPMPGTCAEALVPLCADPAWPGPPARPDQVVYP